MHTKGPWELQKITGGYRIITGGKYTMNLDGPWYPSDEQLEAFKANARLIAAAPELLEAMRKSFDILGNIPEDLSNWNETNSAIQEAHDVLDDAIHKLNEIA